MKNCKLKWNNSTVELGELYRNELTTQLQIIPKTEFDKLKVQFQCEEDPITK